MATATPHVEQAWPCEEAYLLERLLHRVLSHARAPNGSEWFDVDLDTVVEWVERTAAVHGITIEPSAPQALPGNPPIVAASWP